MIRVRDKATGHAYTIHEHLFNPEAHERSDRPAYDAHGDPAAPRHKTTVAKKAAARKPATSAAPSGQKADSPKENS